jgi:hypothetical protein
LLLLLLFPHAETFASGLKDQGVIIMTADQLQPGSTSSYGL